VHASRRLALLDSGALSDPGAAGARLKARLQKLTEHWSTFRAFFKKKRA